MIADKEPRSLATATLSTYVNSKPQFRLTLLSCAWGYQNEAEVGEGIRASGVPREEIWITSKLFEYHHHPEHVEMALKDTLKKLGTDYLDLYLMHWNVSQRPSCLNCSRS